MSIKNLANAMDPNVKARDIKHMASTKPLKSLNTSQV